MVIGPQQTIFGNKVTRASSTEYYDCILQAGLVDTVNILGAQPESLFLHDVDVIFLQ